MKQRKFRRESDRHTISPEETLLDVENLPGFDTARFEGTLERPINGFVFLLMGGIFFLVSMVLAARAGYLMLIDGEAYAMRAQNNWLRQTTIIPERGVVYDRAGVPLAYNVPGFRVLIDTRGAERSALVPYVAELASLLERDAVELASLVERYWQQGEISVDTVRDWEVASKLITRFKDINAIRVESTPLRAYADHPAFSHLVGYVSRVTAEDIQEDSKLFLWGEIGRTGVENAYDTGLRGKLGIRLAEMNSEGTVLSERVYQKEERGENLTLSISADLQKIAYEAIRHTAEERGFTGGSAVALDVRTGDVLALVSYPGFDANVMSTGFPREEVERAFSDQRHPLFFRAIAGLYPPASTVKPFLAAAAIDENVIRPEQVIYTDGKITVPNPFDPARPAVFRDWKNHGSVDMVRALAISSDVYFYTIGGGHKGISGLGVDRMHDYMTRFGFGQKTGVDLPGEKKGLVPSKDWKAKTYPNDPLWRVGDSYNMSIGQGWMLTTPLQIARAVLAIANDGKLLQPHIVKTTAPRVEASPLVSVTNSSLAVARKGMRAAVREGTAQGVASISIPVAAKTGTAQFDKPGRVHSWFMGFLPWEQPELVLVVNMENGPAGNLVGATSVAHEILQKYSTGNLVDKQNESS